MYHCFRPTFDILKEPTLLGEVTIMLGVGLGLELEKTILSKESVAKELLALLATLFMKSPLDSL